MRKRDHKLYSTWKNMMARCYVKSHSNYKHYGAKGITVVERWHEFWNFVEDVDNHLKNGHLLYLKQYQLDKDLLGGNEYSLENCSIITAKENRKLAHEKQQRKIIAISDTEEIEFNSVSEASRKLNIQRGSIQYSLKNGWSTKIGYKFEYFQ
ncbi:MAG: hypothetical protein WAM95_06030 [Bacillus sp. (in: firmicutes)]